MIKIEITDPSDMPQKSLRALAAYLLVEAGDIELDDSDVKTENGVRSIADAAPLLTVPEDTPAATSIPTPTAAFAPPVPPVAPSAQTVAAPVPLGPAPVPGAEVDINGLPWDARIHAGSKARVKDGSWKKQRGVDDALVAQVEAELRAVMSVPAPSPMPLAPPAPPAPPLPPAAGPKPLDFPTFMPKITEGLRTGAITQERLSEVLKSYQIDAIPILAVRHDLIQPVHDALFPDREA